MLNRFLINQCQIITFLILKYDIIENSRIELRGIVFPVQVGGLLGGAQRVCWPPSLSNYWGGLPPPPAPPSSYAYDVLYHNSLPNEPIKALLPHILCIMYYILDIMHVLHTTYYVLQPTLVISTSVISNNRLSRRENLVLLQT